MRLSDAQRRAADPYYSTWLSANAGSGKTAVLVERVLRLLLLGARPGSILCLTYTVTAANEMLGRIQRRLGEWLTLPEDALDDVLQTMQVPVTLAMRQRAQQLFLQVAEDPEGLQIRTMHSFCQSLLGRFPLEAGIPPNSRPMEDEQASLIFASLLTEVIGDADSFVDTAISAAVDYLLAEHPGCMRQGKIQELYAWTLREQIDLTAFDVVKNTQRLAQMWGYANPKSATDMQRAAQTLLDAVARQDMGVVISQMQPADDLGRNDRRFFDGLQCYQAVSDDRAQLAAILSAFVTQSGTIYAKIVTKEFAKIRAIAEFIEATKPAINAYLHHQSVARLLQYNYHLWQLLQAVHQYYQQQKQQLGLLDYHDQLHLVSSMLARDQALDWVRYKLDSRIRFLFVDEAQDTNPAQWQILKCLTAEFYQHEVAPSPPHLLKQHLPEQSLFVVGDPKQSIFRFQGADPLGFFRERQHYHDHSHQRLRRLALQQSYRSSPAVLKMVDAVFAADRYPLPDDQTFGEMQHLAKPEAVFGYVECLPMLASDSNLYAYAHYWAMRIAGWIGQRALPGAERMINEGDIMLLLPGRGKLFSYLNHALIRLGIATDSGDRSRLVDSLAVQDILAVMQVMLDPEDDYAIACALKSSFLGGSDQALHDLALSRLQCNGQGEYTPAFSLFMALQYAAKDKTFAMHDFAAYWAWLQRLYQRCDFSGVNQLLADILYQPCPQGETGMQALLGRLGTSVLRPIQRLEEQAVTFDQHSFSGLQGFVDAMIYRYTHSVDRVEAQNAVRIMTIHAAKGLEAPIVILPHADHLPKDDSKCHLYRLDDAAGQAAVMSLAVNPAPQGLLDQWQQRQNADSAEYWRLGYVAMTRAEQELYVGCAKAPPKKSSKDKLVSLYDQCISAMQEKGQPQSINPVIASGTSLFTEDQAWVYTDTDYVNAAPDKADSEGKHKDDVSQAVVSKKPLWLAIQPNIDPIRPVVAARPISSQAQQRGMALHAIMAGLCGVASGDIQSCLVALVAHQLQLYPHICGEDLRQTVQKVLQNRRIAEFLIYARPEVEVISPSVSDNTATRLRRLDAVAFTPNATAGGLWTIVDFKSDRVPIPGPESDIPPAYARQLQEYAQLWSALHPEATIQTAIVWLESARWHDHFTGS